MKRQTLRPFDRETSRSHRRFPLLGAHSRHRLAVLIAACVIGGLLVVPSAANAASGPTVVSLTFDNGSKSQYDLAYPQLTSHGVHATFFVSSGSITTTQGANFMTWSKLQELQAAGNDVGGKTVNAANLTTDPNPTAQVCNDRQALISHGLDPVSFAYPGGANNATVKDIVKKCGYGNARTAGGLGVPAGSANAETLPPADWLATRAYAPATVTLANMESIVTNASSKGGGWIQIVMGRICDQTADPSNYTTCSTASGHIELGDLHTFLDWVAAAGSAGGAPGGTTIDTVRNVVKGADNVAPTTTIACNGSPCSSSPYTGAVTVTLAATDLGSGVSSTHYTTDGSDPTLASPTYAGPFGVNGTGTSTTVKFRSWDRANNAEATQTQTIQAPADTTAPTTTIACNAAPCTGAPYVDSVSISLSATDTGGAQVDKTYYTTDGSDPTTSSSVYTGPFQISQKGTTTVKYFSTDTVGNAETIQSTQVQVIPYKTTVSLAFDDGRISQYTLGYQQALQPHGATASFYVNSGTIGFSNFMSWNQLSALASAGNDIGGKTVNATNLTTDPDPASQVCNDRKALIQHGLSPVDFAYPGGAGFNDQTIRDIVKNCGYGNARRAGGLSPSGPTYAESVPPADWLATRAYAAPSGQPLTLANMEALVSGAAGHQGGWVQIVIQKVCASSDSTCLSATGSISVDDLNAFLDWVQNAGGAGGAPAGTVLQTVRDQIISADAVTPATAISCDVGACSGGPYNSVVHATLTATDLGSGLESTHYTLDGSTPMLASPTYTGPIPITSKTTLSFRSWDRSGNAETTQSQVIDAEPPPDASAPTTSISCNGSACGANAYHGSVTVSLTADDGTGWGVDKTYYTTDGSTPDTNSTAYSAPFTLSDPNTYTIKFFSKDLAGNAEQVQSKQIQVLPPQTVVSLTFDDQYENFYTYLRPLLLSHGMNATFYVITSDSDGPFKCCMSFSQLRTLQQEGNDIGGHGVDHLNLTDPSTTYDQKVADVCGSRTDLMNHGISDPASYAYPFGSYDSTAESIVQSCGYQTSRAGGGISNSTTTPTQPYVDSLPPHDPYAVRAVDVDAPNAKTLSDLQSFVTAAAAHGGGWLPLTFHEVCHQGAPDYDSCMSTWSAVDDTVLNQFMDWLQTSGEPGGAPAGVSVQTVRSAINAPDSTAPSTVARCDGSPCSGTYGGSVRVALSSSDPGGVGVAKTYYTTDGSDPTTSSQVYSEPLIAFNTTTVKFFSVDNAGNAEPVQSQLVEVGANTDPVIAAAGDIACDPSVPAFNDGNGTNTDCRAKTTSDLLVGADAVLPLGDDQYNCGGTSAFAQSYDPTWGRFKSITYPIPGDKDYATSGGTDCPSTPGAGYYAYFGNRAGDPSKGYYSYDLGGWHVVALNSGPCPDTPSFCAAGSPQEQWLQNDLATHPASCTLAYFQNPRFASRSSGGSTNYAAFWNDLYGAGADVVLNGDSHWYERFQPLDPSGAVDQQTGIREFIVGTGGAGLDTPSSPLSTSAVLDDSTHGVLRMTLTTTGYQWSFLPDEGTFTDSGSASCHNAPDKIAPVTTISCNSGACGNGTSWAPVNVTLAATDTGGSGVDKTYYTTDGSAPTTSSTVYNGAFQVSQTSTVKFFSTDKAGNAEQVQSQSITVGTDPTPPTTTISCNAQACAGPYGAPVNVTLSATDTGGSGVDKTYYTTNGSTPTTSSTVYTGPFSVSQTTTVKFFSRDKAGNAEAVKSQQIGFDTTAPTTTISCNGSPCSTGWYSTTPVTVTLSATDGNGSGVENTYYTTDGSAPTTSSTVYTGPFAVNQTTTVKFFSRDVLKNREKNQSTTIQIDAAAPSVALTNPVSGQSIKHGTRVSVTATASDAGTGSGAASGVKNVQFMLDGTTVLGSDNSSSYTTNWNTTKVALGQHTLTAVATDRAGNVKTSAPVTITIT